MSQYRKGRRFEYEIRDELEALGYFAGRSAGSHTPVDIYAARPHPIEPRRLVIQAKKFPLHKMKGYDWREIEKLCEWADAWDAIAVLVTKEERGTNKWWTFYQIGIIDTRPARERCEEMVKGWLAPSK